ncbi:glycoside hydrolase family 61 protein, partial [Trichodelitschia bisporula]
AILGSASLAAAHGIVKSLVIDGITYPAYDPRLDTEWGVKRVMWEYSNTTGSSRGLGPVMDVSSPDIACRFSPLQAPQIHAVARAGSTISFKWTDWFANHKGPLLTYMGLMPTENSSPNDVSYFKIHESTYDSKTEEWGSDVLIKNNNVMTATIPSDIKPGFYVVRHELISLHFSFRANTTTKVSGAQFFPQCVKVQVLGEGTATPPGVRFPGGYQWDHPGILDNIYYGVNRYPSPGPAVY